MNRASNIRRGGGLIAYKLKKLVNKAAREFYTDIHTAAWKGVNKNNLYICINNVI